MWKNVFKPIVKILIKKTPFLWKKVAADPDVTLIRSERTFFLGSNISNFTVLLDSHNVSSNILSLKFILLLFINFESLSSLIL